MVQKEFQIAVDEVTKKCRDYFSNRLVAIYLTGSVGTNEAIAGESDLDYWGFISDELNEDDKLWVNNTSLETDDKYEIFDGVHLKSA